MLALATSRRHLIGFFSFGGAGVLLTACIAPGPRPAAEPTSGAGDFSERFASFEVADEPNGDLSQVVWPDFVMKAGTEVKQLYEFQITHGDLMRWMPCFCGCGQSDGHRSNRDCYVQAVKADGSVMLDAMAPT